MAGAPTPPLLQLAWAAGAGSGYITNPIPVASQISIKTGAASLTDGFPPLTMTAETAGGVPPFGQDANGILYALSANTVSWTAGQAWPFSSTLATALGGYGAGAIVPMANGAGYWLNQTAGNSNNPDTTTAATSGWVPLTAYGTAAISGLTNSNVTLTAAQAAMPVITLAGSLTGNVQIIFPPWSRTWRVTNNTTGSYSVTCKTASGTGIILAQGAPTKLLAGDGTNIVSVGQQSGTFLATSIDISGNPTGTVNYVTDGVTATIYTGSDVALVNGTSTNTTCHLSGLPAFLIPAKFAGGYLCIYGGEDNGSSTWASAAVSYDGLISFVKLATFGGAAGGWTASGQKAVPAFCFTYPLA